MSEGSIPDRYFAGLCSRVGRSKIQEEGRNRQPESKNAKRIGKLWAPFRRLSLKFKFAYYSTSESGGRMSRKRRKYDVNHRRSGRHFSSSPLPPLPLISSSNSESCQRDLSSPTGVCVIYRGNGSVSNNARSLYYATTSRRASARES